MEKWQDYFRKVTILLETSHFLLSHGAMQKKLFFFVWALLIKVPPRKCPNRCGGATYLDLGSWCTATFEEGGRVGRSQLFATEKMVNMETVILQNAEGFSGKTENMFLRVWGWCVLWLNRLWVGLTIFHTRSCKWSEKNEQWVGGCWALARYISATTMFVGKL